MEEKFKGHEDFIKQHGAFCWSELMTTDVPGALKFYTKLFGWTTEEMHMEGMTYTLAKVGGTDVGGIMATPPEAQGMPPMWGVYVTVDNVDATAKMAEELGGKDTCPTDGHSGRWAILRDSRSARGGDISDHWH